MITVSLFSQNTNIKKKIDADFLTLKKQPNTPKKAKELITLFKYASKKRYYNYQIIDEAIEVSKKIYYTNGIARAYNRKGVSKRHQQSYYESIENHKKALLYLNKSTDTMSRIKCLNSLGSTYRKINLEKQSFKYYFEAYGLAEKINNKKSIAIALNGIGDIFVNIHEPLKSIHYFKRSLKIAKESNDKKGVEYGHANIGKSFIYLKEYDSAYFYINKAIELSANNKRIDTKAIKQNLLGFLFQKKKDYKTSNKYYNQAKPVLEKAGNIRYLSNTLINLGLNKILLKEEDEGLSLIQLGIKKAKEIKSRENILLGYNALSSYYTKKNQYKKSLETYKKANAIKDSILNEASQKSIISSQVAYESYEKDKTIKRLAVEKAKSEKKAASNFKKLLYGGAVSIAFIVGLSLLFLQYRKKTVFKLQKIKEELQDYVLQINELKNSNVPKKNKTSIDDRIATFDLSDREEEVLKLIMEGVSNNEISEALYISPNTVKTHIKNIYSKLEVNNRIQVVKKIGV